MLPTISFGDREVSRLIVGGNPFSGNSHVSRAMDIDMLDYYSTENIKKVLHSCVKSGINTMQLRGDRHITRMIREFRNEGGEMHWIAQTCSELVNFESGVDAIADCGALGIYLHGTMTDALFKEGKYQEIKDKLSYIRQTGCQTGLCTHIPEVIEYAEEHNFDVDFYMACVYNLSKVHRVSSAVSGKANEGEPFDEEDREIMLKTIRGTRKTCLAFKILGASRRCGTREDLESAFAEAYKGIKENDAVIVGMFTKYTDQVTENAGIVKRLLEGK